MEISTSDLAGVVRAENERLEAARIERLDRVEQKLDAVSDQIHAFPVVGQRVGEIERRLGQVEGDIRTLNNQGQTNALSLAKIGGVFTVLGVIGAVVAREIIKL